MKRRASHSSPVADKGEPPRENFHFPGLWRDGKYLVIDLADHYFPRRCLKTNEVIAPPFDTITLTCHGPSNAELNLLQNDPRRFARVKYLVFEGPKQRTSIQFQFALPLTPHWQAIFRSVWGTRLLWAGAALLIGSYCSWILNDSIQWSWLPQFTLLTSLVLLVAGGVFQLYRRLALTVPRLFDGKIWVGGVDSEWLRPLPAFVPSRRMLQEEIQLLTWSFWTCVVVGLVLLGLFLIASLRTYTIKPQLPAVEAEYRNVRFALLTGAAVAILLGNRARMLLRVEEHRLHKLYPVLDRRTFRRLRQKRSR